MTERRLMSRTVRFCLKLCAIDKNHRQKVLLLLFYCPSVEADALTR